MEFRLLGPVEAWSDSGPVDLGPRQQRLLLAVLALKVNRLVPVHQLVDLTWPSAPPQTAQHAIHVRISGLRAALAVAGGNGSTRSNGSTGAAIVTRGAAYMLSADPMSIDAHRFRALVGQARSETDDVVKVGMFRQAIEMWRGPALAGAAMQAVADQLCRGLDEIRLMAVEDCLDAELRLGRHRSVVDELTDLAAEHPYQQRLLGQLMLALHRAGRTPEALNAYLSAQSRLVDELGLDPEPRLQALYRRILRGDPALDPGGGIDPVPQPRALLDAVPQPRAVLDPPVVEHGVAVRVVDAAPPAVPTSPEVPAVAVRAVEAVPGQSAAHRTRRLFRLLGLMTTRILAGSWRKGVLAMAGLTLEALRLTKRYGGRTAVDELSFTAQQGEVLGLLGSNGAGKTTTIRLLTTMLRPTSGEFSVTGIPHTSQTEIRRRVGVLPESAGYPGHQTGLDYLAYQARLFGMNRSDAARAAGRLLAEVGLEHRATSRISTYSRGMRQRLGIARALLNEPAVVLLDEPTLGLDPAGQRQVISLVRDIVGRTGATVVLSTHTLPEVEEVCSRVLILDAGRVVMSDSVSEVTRAVAARRSGLLRVPAELAGRATAALSALPGVTVEMVGDRPDLLRVSRTAPVVPSTAGPDVGDLVDPDAAMNPALQAVLNAGVPVLSYEVEGARLTDAFLSMTGGVR